MCSLFVTCETVSDSEERGRVSLQENQFSLSACDRELFCGSQAWMIVWVQMGIPDTFHSVKEQMGSSGMAATFKDTSAKTALFTLLLSVRFWFRARRLSQPGTTQFVCNRSKEDTRLMNFNQWTCGIVIPPDNKHINWQTGTDERKKYT